MALLPVVMIGILVAIAVGSLWVCQKELSSKGLVIGLLLLSCLAGFARMKMEQQPLQADEYLALTRGKSVEVLGIVRGISEKESFYALTLSDTVMVWDAKEYPIPGVLLYIGKEEFEREEKRSMLRIGMEISAKGKPEKPSVPRNPGEFDFRTYYRAVGIVYQVFGKEMKVVNSHYIPYDDFLYRFRLAAIEQLERISEPEDLGIFQAAILGEKGSLEEEIRELYQRNGIAHLLAISGLHVSLVGLGVYRLLRKAGLGYGAAGMAGSMLIVSYGILTGASASVVRAVSMVLIYMLAEYLGRCYDMLSAASCIGVLLLLESPYLLFQSGFQLSFGAVAAIGGVGPWLVKQMTPAKLIRPLLLGLAIQLVTYPIILYHFFEYPIYGIFLNLLVIPLMTYVIISGISGLLLSLLSPALGSAALGTGHYILRLYVWLCRQCDRIPGSNLIIGRPELWQIGIYIAVLATCFWWLCRCSYEKRNWFRRWLMLLSVGTACFFLLWQLPLPNPEVTFLDVGQGDGICIRTNQSVILIDGGSSSNKRVGESSIEPFLKSQGISRVDYAIVSHGDADHISGLQYLLEKEKGVHIENLILPWLGKEEESYEKLIAMMEQHGGQIHWMKEGERLRADELTLTCLYHGDERKKKEKNEHSLLLRMDYRNTQMLLTGDMSSEGELDTLDRLSAVDVLKVAHHGSKYSTCQEFLNRTKPVLAVISCGEDNSYGHPHSEVLERLSDAQTQMLITQDTGAITFYLTDQDIRFSAFLHSGQIPD